MHVSAFDYDLPEALIASRPATPRETARLLVVPRAPGSFQNETIAHLPHLLRPGDLLVFNNTKVLPARLFGQRGSVRVEVMLNRPLADDTWEAFARPLKRLHPGDILTFAADFKGEVVSKETTGGHLSLRFHLPEGVTLEEALHLHGHMPLPPYISRADDTQDATDYQTLFAQHPGAVAAPTASLHFTPALMDQLAERGVHHTCITLHVGAGTYQPVRVEDTRQHVMHAEWADVTADVVARIAHTKAHGGRVVAVGTTVLRALESSQLKPFSGDTRLFITPGYRFTTADLLLTNFHLPRSTLLMLVSAFAGQTRIRNAYTHAVQHGYRFYSYGDACLLERDDAAL